MSVETEVLAEAELEKINHPEEFEETFEEASLDRAVSRSRQAPTTMPPLNLGEKITVAGLISGVGVVIAGVGYMGYKIYEINPLWMLLPGGFLAVYLAGGYDHWRASKK